MPKVFWLLFLLQFNGIPRVVAQRSTAFKLTSILQQLNEAYNINLNIFINWNEREESFVDLKRLDASILQLNLSADTFNNFHMLGKYSENALIIVYIKNPPLDTAVAHFLPYLLWKVHETQIVFITNNKPDAWLEYLFSYSFREGFINVLLVHQENQTTSLYTYNPYPVIQIHRLSQLEDYFSSRLQLGNFHHFPLRTVLFKGEPRILHYVNRKGELVTAGYMFNALNEFIKRHNGTLKTFGEPKSFDIGVYMLQKKIIDFAAYPKEIQWNLSSTAPLYLLREYFAVPYSRPIASYLYFSRPFQSTLWLAVMGTVLFSTIALYIIYKQDGSEISMEFLCSWCYVMFLPQPVLRILKWQQFAIHCLMLLWGFILTNLYLTLLSSMLTSGLFEPQLNTVEDLISSPYRLLADDFIANYFRKLDIIPAEILDRMVIVHGHTLDKARNDLNTSFMYICYEDRLDGILYQQHLLKVPRFKKIPKSFMDGIMAFPLAHGLPYLKMLNIYLRRIFESGVLQKMKSDAWMDTIESGLYILFKSEGVEQKPYDLEFYFYAFAFWGAGLAIATISFLLELVRERINSG